MANIITANANKTPRAIDTQNFTLLLK